MSHPIVAALGDPNPRARIAACRRAAVDPAAVLLLEALAATFDDADARVALAAADAFATIGRGSEAADDLLHRALRSPAAQVRAVAALASLRRGPPAARLIPPLVSALASDAPALRWRAVSGLVECAVTQAEVLPLLRGLATSRDASPRVREMAVHGLREAEADPESRADVLRLAARDRDPAVRRAATLALAAAESRGTPDSRAG